MSLKVQIHSLYVTASSAPLVGPLIARAERASPLNSHTHTDIHIYIYIYIYILSPMMGLLRAARSCKITRRCLGIQSSLTMWIVAALTYTAVFVPGTQAIICYRCTITPPHHVGDADQPCSKFDGSSRYYQDCPTSTFCMKHMIHYSLLNGTILNVTAERNCASQKYVFQDYNYSDKKWQKKEIIDTKAYQDGCFKEASKGTPNGPSEYCFCSSNYCNSSSLMDNPLQKCSVLIFLVLLFLNLS